jgi:hypothetical protein
MRSSPSHHILIHLQLPLVPINVELFIDHPFGDWKEKWEGYDLKALNLTAWQVSLGVPFQGEHNRKLH